jgi:hypothetical protein
LGNTVAGGKSILKASGRAQKQRTENCTQSPHRETWQYVVDERVSRHDDTSELHDQRRQCAGRQAQQQAGPGAAQWPQAPRHQQSDDQGGSTEHKAFNKAMRSLATQAASTTNGGATRAVSDPVFGTARRKP